MARRSGRERPAVVGHLCIEPLGPRTDEMAVAVADDWQGRGIGRGLVEAAVAFAGRDPGRHDTGGQRSCLSTAGHDGLADPPLAGRRGADPLRHRGFRSGAASTSRTEGSLPRAVIVGPTAPSARGRPEQPARRCVDGRLARDWLARKDSNLQSPDPESGALPFGHSPATGPDDTTGPPGSRRTAAAPGPTAPGPVWPSPRLRRRRRTTPDRPSGR